jgi:hypothetical protein
VPPAASAEGIRRFLVPKLIQRLLRLCLSADLEEVRRHVVADSAGRPAGGVVPGYCCDRAPIDPSSRFRRSARPTPDSEPTPTLEHLPDAGRLPLRPHPQFPARHRGLDVFQKFDGGRLLVRAEDSGSAAENRPYIDSTVRLLRKIV